MISRDTHNEHMIVSDETAEEFRQVYRKSYGEDISLDDAREEAGHLLDLFRLLRKPLPSEREAHRRAIAEKEQAAS